MVAGPAHPVLPRGRGLEGRGAARVTIRANNRHTKKAHNSDLPPLLQARACLCSEIEKEQMIRIMVCRDAEGEEELTNLSEQKRPHPSLA